MARELSSISRFGLTEPFELQVARGQITGHSVLHIFGHNADIDATEETIWPVGGSSWAPCFCYNNEDKLVEYCRYFCWDWCPYCTNCWD